MSPVRRADGHELRPWRRVARIALRIGVEGGRHLGLAERRQHAGRHARLQLRDNAKVPGVDEDDPQRRVGGDAAPAAAALGSREDEARDHAVRRERAHVDGLVEELRAVLLRLWRDLADFLAGHAVAREPGGLHRERLRRPRLIARRVEARHRTLLDAEQGLASEPVEHEQQALLRHLRDGRHALAVHGRLEERRLRADVPVVDVVMRELEVPDALARRRPQREQRRRVEVQARTAAAEVLIGRVAERNEHHVVHGVDRHRHPHAGPAPILPAVQAPGADVLFAVVRDDVEAPDFLAGDEIERARIARHAVAATFTRARGDDGEVLVERGRRVRRR